MPTRRSFLQTTAATGLALSASTYARAAGANERLRVGVVGFGVRGRSLLYSYSRVMKEHNADLTGICDLWSVGLERGAALAGKVANPAPRQYRRLEDLLAAKDIDAVILATPDHAHAKQLRMCLAAGKHVYCEKPFANTPEDALAAIDACRASDRVVTLGTQRRSDPRHLGALDTVKTGVLGEIVSVEVVQNALSPYRRRNAKDIPLLKESDTDWKAFLAGKPDRPFDPHQYLEWRLFREFSSGIIDQWMTHLIDTVHMLAGGSIPRSVVALGGTYAWKDGRENGDTVRVALDYPEGFLASYSCTLANGFGSGARIIGREASMEYEDAWQVTPLTKRGEKPAAPKPIAPREGLKGANVDEMHIADWLDCVRRGDRKTRCTAEHGWQHAVACIMAAQALRTGRRQVYDDKTRTIREG